MRAVWVFALVTAIASTGAAAPIKVTVAEATSGALIDQMKCQKRAEPSRAINAMLANHLIRYSENESGVYLFTPTAPLTFLGLKVTHISGFDYDGFNKVPPSTMVGTAPPVFLQIDVAASVSELRKRALGAGLIESAPPRNGFRVSNGGSYLAGEAHSVTSNIECSFFP